MRKLSAIPLVAAIVFVLVSALPVLADPVEKITICHAAGQAGTTQFVTLELPFQAVFGNGGHFNEDGTTQAGHEDDYLGECEEEETSTTSPTTSTTAGTTTTETTNPGSSTTTTETTTVATTTPTTTTAGTSTTATPTTDQTTVPSLLPFTGISDVGELMVLGAALLAMGTVVVRVARDD